MEGCRCAGDGLPGEGGLVEVEVLAAVGLWLLAVAVLRLGHGGLWEVVWTDFWIATGMMEALGSCDSVRDGVFEVQKKSGIVRRVWWLVLRIRVIT